jgi:hypothetical protein
MVPQLFYRVVIDFVTLVCAPLLGVVSLTPPFAMSRIALPRIRVRVGVRIGV